MKTLRTTIDFCTGIDKRNGLMCTEYRDIVTECDDDCEEWQEYHNLNVKYAELQSTKNKYEYPISTEDDEKVFLINQDLVMYYELINCFWG